MGERPSIGVFRFSKKGGKCEEDAKHEGGSAGQRCDGGKGKRTGTVWTRKGPNPGVGNLSREGGAERAVDHAFREPREKKGGQKFAGQEAHVPQRCRAKKSGNRQVEPIPELCMPERVPN